MNPASNWCWHQHGWLHANHEADGKKQEFGPSRCQADLKRDIGRGRQRLEKMIGHNFFPVFTPPWNRCDQKTLAVLEDLDYAAVSRSRKSRSPSLSALPEFDVNVDLHTRKEKSAAAGWHNLLAEMQQAIASGRCGIMIHHQRMNVAAFEFLEILLVTLAGFQEIKPVHFKDMLDA
jgi:hypothetical protein